MAAIPTYLKPKPGLFLALAGTALFACTCRAQEREKKPEEASKVAGVDVTPAQATSPVGGKLEFKAVAKDAAGQPLPDAVKYWFAAPFDAASAEQNGEVSFVEPGEITIGAVIGKKI
ncbi:MAG TPA: hypothetical protein VKB61_06380, partial [Candidatus Acidoferrum sp.]|nr:hypothetical protein [Candidatus Acidoferrum sp.]